MAKKKTKKSIATAPSFEKVQKRAIATNKFLGQTVTSHQELLERAIVDLERRIVSGVKLLKTSKGGVLKGAGVNLRQAQKVHARLKIYFEETFGVASKSAVKDFGKVATWIKNTFNHLGIAATFTDVDRRAIAELKRSTYTTFKEFGAVAQAQISEAMYSHVVAQAPFADLVASVKSVLTDQTAKRAKQHAFDAVMNFHNSISTQKAHEAGLKHYMYVGSIMDNTRQFCADRVGMIFTEKEIRSWTFNWSGKSGPAITNRGGYNCRHHWQAVSPKWFPNKKVTYSGSATKKPKERRKKTTTKPRKRQTVGAAG